LKRERSALASFGVIGRDVDWLLADVGEEFAATPVKNFKVKIK
jgi:hypothetical protein